MLWDNLRFRKNGAVRKRACDNGKASGADMNWIDEYETIQVLPLHSLNSKQKMKI
jgi:hypothetical protein